MSTETPSLSMSEELSPKMLQFSLRNCLSASEKHFWLFLDPLAIIKNTGTATMCKGVSLKSPRSPLRSGSLGPLTGLPCILTRFKHATAVSDWVGHDSSGSISLRLGSAELLLVLRAIKVRKAF